MKILQTLALACAIVFTLAACGPDESAAPNRDRDSETAEATPAVAPEAVAESAPEAKPMEEAPEAAPAKSEWVSLFNGENLDGWTQRGAATWEVKDGAMVGQSPGGQGHIYATPELTDLEVKGMFMITDEGGGANSGLYFRCNPPEDNVDGYPNGYEAQICHNQDAHTGWLWKPGSPTGKADKLITKDGEWFSMRVKMVGKTIQIWVQDELVMTYEDADYTKGYFAIQCHNDGMTVAAKDLYYRDLSAQ
jgi:hypothetical protein